MPALGVYASEIPSLIRGNYANGGMAVRPGAFGWDVGRNMLQVLGVALDIEAFGGVYRYQLVGSPRLAAVEVDYGVVGVDDTGYRCATIPPTGDNPLLDIAESVDVALVTDATLTRSDISVVIGGFLVMRFGLGQIFPWGTWEMVADADDSEKVNWFRIGGNWNAGGFCDSTGNPLLGVPGSVYPGSLSNSISMPAFP